MGRLGGGTRLDDIIIMCEFRSPIRGEPNSSLVSYYNILI